MRPTAKAGDWPPDPTASAPEIYPDIAVPGRVFPSHAYQHATVLHEQLAQIAELVED